MWSYLISWCRISVTVFVRNVCQCRKRWQKPHTINLVFLHQPVESVTFHFLPLQYHSGCFTSDLVCDVLSWAYLPRCVFCVTLPRWHCRFAIMSSISQLQNSNKSLQSTVWRWWAGILIFLTFMWLRPPQCWRMSGRYTLWNTRRHIWPPMLLRVGAVRQWSWQEKLGAFHTGWCCCNLLHTNTFHCPWGSVHTQMCLHTSTYMCTHKHLWHHQRIWTQ